MFTYVIIVINAVILIEWFLRGMLFQQQFVVYFVTT